MDDLTTRHLCFYNLGPVSGASQPHKHLQLIEFPEEFVPWADKVILPALGSVASTPLLPFANFIAQTPKDGSGDALHATYKSLINASNASLKNAGFFSEPYSHSVLLTKEWMVVVPRTRETWNQASLNSVGMIGMILVKREQEVQSFIEHGVLNILKELSVPKIE